MKKNKWFVKLGYILALLCFIVNIIASFTQVLNTGIPVFLGLGGVLLLVTSICKFVIDRRHKRRGRERDA